MPTVSICADVAFGVLRFLEIGWPVASVARHFKLSRQSVYNLWNRSRDAKAEAGEAIRCIGCGCKHSNACCLTCRGRAIDTAKRLLAARQPLERIQERLAVDFPALSREQIAAVVNPLLLIPLLDPRGGETRPETTPLHCNS